MKNNDQKRNKWLGMYFVFLMVFLSLFFFSAIHASLPSNALAIPLNNNSYLTSFFPQGWGFYSKNPREEGMRLYDYDTQQPSTYWPHNSTQNWFGLKRTGRSQGIEAGLIQSSIPDHYWQDCDEDPFTCASQLTTEDSIEIHNETPFPTICGEQLFVLSEPIPWAWSKYKEHMTMPSQIVRVNVTCSNS